MKKFLVVLIVLCGLLAVTNPDTDSFLEWAQVKISQDSGSSMLGKISSMAAKPALRVQTTRKDIFVFSVFTVVNITGEDMKYLGIMKQFIRLK